MKRIQELQKDIDKEMGWLPKSMSYSDSKFYLPYNHLLLTTEVAEEIRIIFKSTEKFIEEGLGEDEAFKMACNERRELIGLEIADCIAYLSKFANFFTRDIEEDFFFKDG